MQMWMICIPFAVSLSSVTLAKSKIFLDFRAWLYAKSESLGSLFMCPYCLAHWIGLFFTALSGNAFNHGLMGFLALWMAITWLAAVLNMVLLIALRSAVKPIGDFNA